MLGKIRNLVKNTLNFYHFTIGLPSEIGSTLITHKHNTKESDMPRKWKRKTTRGSWAEETIKLALKFIEEGNSIKASYKKYGIPVRTLQDRRRKNNTSKPVLGRKTTFNPEQEQALTNRIKTLSNTSNGLTATAVRRAAFDFAEKNGIPHKFSENERLAGRDWLYGFLQRNQSIRIRKNKDTSINRIPEFNREETATANSVASTRNNEEERIPVVIKEEIDVSQDYDYVCLPTTGTSSDEECMDCESTTSTSVTIKSEISPENIKEYLDEVRNKNSLFSPRLGISEDEDQTGFQNMSTEQTDSSSHCNKKSKCINSQTQVTIPDKVLPVENLMPDILKITDGVSLDIQNILTQDISNLGKINPANIIHTRNSIPHPSPNAKINSTLLETEYSELEAKLRIYYLNSTIKKEDELIDSNIKLRKLQILREQTELNNSKKCQLLRVKNLELKNAILKSRLKRKCKCK